VGKVEVAERLLVQIWKRQLVEAGKLVTDSGETLQVIYPGRENKDRGPDFVGAIVTISCGEVLRGDIELHSKASDWRSHGHGRDPNYDEVILQVVWEGHGEVVLRSGKAVPTLSLRDCIECSLDEVRRELQLPMVPGEPCFDARQRLGDIEIGRLLDEAGEERFRLKADYFASRIGHEPPSQTLYRGIMGALGYTKNKEPFEELACRLPLAVLEGICRGKPAQERILILKALLLGKAGLLLEDADGGLEQIWNRLGDGETMGVSCWRVFRVRPENHPERRLVGAAYLLARFVKIGLFEGVLQSVTEAHPGKERLEHSFMVGAPEPCAAGERNLIGQGRAREIVINVVLPFTLTWAEANFETKLAQRVWALYRSYPKAGEYGITRELGKLLMGSSASKVVNSAQRQQGLIHIDRTFCRPRECARCPLTRRLTPGLLAS